VAQDRRNLASAEEVVGEEEEEEERASWWRCSLNRGKVSECTRNLTEVMCCSACCCLHWQGVVFK